MINLKISPNHTKNIVITIDRKKYKQFFQNNRIFYPQIAMRQYNTLYSAVQEIQRKEA